MGFSKFFNTYEIVEPPPITESSFRLSMPTSSFIDYQPSSKPKSNNITIYPVTKQEESFYRTDFSPSNKPNNISKPSVTTSSIVTNVVNTGRQYVGTPYTWGGKKPSTGFDCSGFVSYVYKQNGVDLPSSTDGLFKVGTEVSLNNAKPGDIICSRGSGATGRHVQMVSRVDNNGQIYVLEAKGKKYGVVEEPLTKKKIISVRRPLDNSVQPPNQKFTSKNQFVKTINAGYRRALQKQGLNPDYADILTAQAAMESGWGTKLSGTYNYGGIKVTDSFARNNPDKTNRTLTVDYNPRTGQNVKHYQNFRNFSSIDDYCNYKVSLLTNNRYKAFDNYSPVQPYEFVYHILSRGYGSDYGGEQSKKYASEIKKIYNSVLNILKT